MDVRLLREMFVEDVLGNIIEVVGRTRWRLGLSWGWRVHPAITRCDLLIEPQYRTKIKSYITEQKVRPVQTREKIVVGAKVPSEVDLVAVPSDWGPSESKYRYVYSGDRVMLVDPGIRIVVQEID